MDNMFYYATSFNQNIGSWNLSSIPAGSTTAMGDGMLFGTDMDCQNYSLTLQGWAANLGNTTPTGISLGAQVTYSSTDAATVAAHAALVAAGWTLNDVPGSCFVALPIGLLGFTAQAQGNHTALLQWQTATETNNKGFAVQRSADGANFTTLAFVNSKAANGTGSAPLSYTFTDKNPLGGINYYRLAQTDLNGAVTYSALQSVQFGNLMGIYPNPVQSELTVTGVPSAAVYKLFNAGGAAVLQGTLQAGVNSLSVSGVAEGIYFLRIEAGNAVSTYEIHVVK
jgi:hypothetical protein